MAFPAFNFTPASVLSNAIFGLNLLSGSLRIDVVGIFDGTSFQQLFQNARPVKASVRPNKKVMQYPVETGVVLSDHQVILQKQIDLSLIIPAEFYGSTYQQIAAASVNATLLTVQTRAGVFPNMIIESYTHEETPEMYDAITMALRLTEVLYVAPASIAQPNAPAGYAPADPANQTTQRRGQQFPLSLSLPASILGYVKTFSAWGR